MLITVKTFNGHNINDGVNYQTLLLNPHGHPDAAPVFLDQPNNDSVDSGVFTVNTQAKILSVTIRNYGSRYSLISQLKKWFKRGTRANLVVSFVEDGDTDYQISCRAVSIVQDEGYPDKFLVTLQTGVTPWRAVTEDTEPTWTVTGTSETLAIDVEGDDETYLSVDLTTVAGPAAGYLYQNLYRLPNTPGIVHGLIPWCITLNTATLVSGGKMQADCDDLRIVDLRTGQELKRWISGANTTSTKVWVILDLAKGFSLALKTNVAGAGTISTLEFAVNDNVKAAIAEMPSAGIVYHGNEWFAYSAKDAVACTLTISSRGAFGTTVEAHTAGDAFLYIQYPLVMRYGNASVSAPSTNDSHYDDDKPLFSLSSSSNTSWVWTASDKFYDPDHPNRLPQWTQRLWGAGPLSEVYYIKQDAASGDPAFGLKVASYPNASNVWQPVNPIISVQLYRAAGITSLSMTGESYRSNANWPMYSRLDAGYYGFADYTLWSESKPGSAASWSTWTHNGATVTGNVRSIWFLIAYAYPAGENAYASFEMLTCTAGFNSSNIPTGALIGEVGNYPLALTITNTTNGDAVSLDFTMLIGPTFSINGETSEISYDGVNAYGAVTPNDLARSIPIRLNGGETNTIQISGADLGTLEADLHWYRRRL